MFGIDGTGHHGRMRRILLKITAAALFVAALAGWMWVLFQHSLEQADQLTSVVGLFVNTALTVASLVVSWLALRAATPADRPPGTGAGPAPGTPGEAGATTHTSTFTANDQATQYNAPGGSMTINNDGERR